MISLDQLGPGGIAIHKDGRIFIAAMDIAKGVGAVLAVEPDGWGTRTIARQGPAPCPTTWCSTPGAASTSPTSGAPRPTRRGASTTSRRTSARSRPCYRASRRRTASRSALTAGSCGPRNFSRNLLHRVELADATTATPFGTAVPYHFTGPAPNSTRADADGNLYVAMYGQGRVLAFSRNGIPIGQVLLPGRDEGHNLRSTSVAIRPGTDDLIIVTNDGEGGQGATLFHARAFAKALPLYSHR